MRNARNGNGKGWACILVFVIVAVIFLPSLMRLSGVNPDEVIEKGTFLYIAIHDGRWIVYGIIGYFIAEMRFASKGLLKKGLEEWREWRERHQ